MSTPVAVDPADALQVGLYQLLNGDATLGGLVDGVYDQVPEDAPTPYVVIGEMLSTEDSVHGGHGRQTVATVHTWARERSYRTVNQVGARLVALLARQAAALDAVTTGQTVYMVTHEFAQTMRDPDPEIRHRVDRFRVWSSQEDES